MSTSPAATARPGPRTRQRRVSMTVIAIAVVAAAAVLVAALSALFAEPERVTVVIENPTAYHVNVDVRPADGGNRVGIGTVAAGATRSFERVIDQGERWAFEYSYAGVDVPPVEVPRDEVVAGPVVIPELVEEHLREAGVPQAPS